MENAHDKAITTVGLLDIGHKAPDRAEVYDLVMKPFASGSDGARNLWLQPAQITYDDFTVATDRPVT